MVFVYDNQFCVLGIRFNPQEEGNTDGPASDQVKGWLEKLNLSRYVSLFVEQEIDWDTIPWLTEEVTPIDRFV